MAVTKIKPVKSTLSKALDYIQNPDKTDGKMLVSSFGCSLETADIEFEFTIAQALDRGNNLAHHLIQSFEPGEVDYQKAHEIGKQLADAVTKGQYEYVLTTHIDKGHVHNHIIFCAVNFVDYHKYNSNKRSYYGIRNMSDRLCRENGLSVVVPQKGGKGKSYAEYLAEKTGTSWKGKTNMFSGLVRCADCGEKLYYCTSNSFETRQDHFVCSTSRKKGKEVCDTHFIRAVVLEEGTLQHMRLVIQCVADYEDAFRRALGAKRSEEAKKELFAKKRTLQKSENRLAELDRLFKRIYEDMVNGKLSEARFQMLSDDYEQEQADLRAKIEMLENEIQNQEDQAENVDRFIRQAKKYLYLEKLTPTILNDMVNAVYVHAPDKSSGHRVQDVTISYNYIGILPANLLYDVMNGKAA